MIIMSRLVLLFQVYCDCIKYWTRFILTRVNLLSQVHCDYSNPTVLFMICWPCYVTIRIFPSQQRQLCWQNRFCQQDHLWMLSQSAGPRETAFHIGKFHSFRPPNSHLFWDCQKFLLDSKCILKETSPKINLKYLWENAHILWWKCVPVGKIAF